MSSASVTILPAEILLRIFHNLNDDSEYINNCKPVLVSLPRVCWSWNRLATPLLYRRLSTYMGEKRKEYHYVHRMLHTLRTHPQFYSYVRDLDLTVDCIDAKSILEFVEKVSPHVKSLRTHGLCFGKQKDKNILSKIGSMRLEKLSIGGMLCGQALEYLVQQGVVGSLHAFDIRPYGQECDRSGPLEWCTKPYTSPLQHLKICAPTWDLGTLRGLLKWPQSLRSLDLDISKSAAREWGCQPTNACYTTGTQQALDLQRESLQEIKLVGYFPDDNGQLVDLSAFPNLTLLEVQQSNLFKVAPEDASRKLSCPKLERLAVDMNYYDQQHDIWHKLNEEKLDWLLKFIKGRREHLADDRLNEIHIIYHCNSDELCMLPRDAETGHINNASWPMEHLCIAAKRLEPLGIRLTWPEPYWTIEKWEAMILDENFPEHKYDDTSTVASPTEDGEEEADETLLNGKEQQKGRHICEFLPLDCRAHPGPRLADMRVPRQAAHV